MKYLPVGNTHAILLLLHDTKTYFFEYYVQSLTSYSDVLKTGHQFAVETAHSVTGQKSSVFLFQMQIYFAQVRQQTIYAHIIFF